MNVAMTAKGDFVEIQGSAEGRPFPRDGMDRMLDRAAAGIRKLVKAQKDALARSVRA